MATEPELPGEPADEQPPVPIPSYRDVRMAERAFRERWPMSASVRVDLLKRITRILDDDAWEGIAPKPSNRLVVSAFRALLHADRLTLDWTRLELLARLDALTVKDVLAEAEAAALEYVPEPEPEPPR